MDEDDEEGPLRSEECAREVERLRDACGDERCPPVLLSLRQQHEMARRAEAPRGGAPPGSFIVPRRVVLSAAERDGADAVALSRPVRTMADRGDAALLADSLTSHSSDPLVQARAIFRWVAEAIAFEETEAVLPQDAATVLERRTAVGDGYANLVQELAQLANLRVGCVYGHGRSSGEAGWRFTAAHEVDATVDPPVNHCWNALYVGNSWRFFDAAWAAGRVGSDGAFHRAFDEAYWLLSPEAGSVMHKPLLPGWQLLPEPVGNVQYRQSVPRGAAFFRYGLELLSHPENGTIRCGQRVGIRLGHAPHLAVHFACVLVKEHAGEETVASDGWPQECCMVETHDSWSCVHVTAPPRSESGTGIWELRVMIAPGSGMGGYVEDTYRAMEWCVSYRLDFGRSVTPLPSRFPFVARGVTVIEPMNRGIPNSRVRFRLRWKGATKPTSVSAVIPGATSTHIDTLQAVYTPIADEMQYFGVVNVGDAEIVQIQVSFQWKNPDFLVRNPDFLLRNLDFLLKNVDFLIKQAEFETPMGTKTTSLAEFCTFEPEKPYNVPGSELRIPPRTELAASRPAAVFPNLTKNPATPSWEPLGEAEVERRRHPPVDVSELEVLGAVLTGE